MGYTHYWDRFSLGKDIDRAKWAELNHITDLIIKLAEGKTTDTAGGYHTDKPVKLVRRGRHSCDNLTNSMKKIAFNGIGDLGHETFYLPGPDAVIDSSHDPKWDFCKTARKPYDVVVVAVLEAARSLGLLRWNSDGGAEAHKQGIELYKAADQNAFKAVDEGSSTPWTDEVLAESGDDILEQGRSLLDHARSLEVTVHTLVKALKAVKPDCDYESDEQHVEAVRLRTLALEAAKNP